MASPPCHSTGRLELGLLGLLFVVLFIRFPVNFLRHPPYLMDYEVYHATALRVLAQDAAHLYAPTYSEQALFKYAPVWALLMAPLGWVSAHAGAVVWSTLSVLAFVFTCWIGHRVCRQTGWPPIAAAPLVVTLLLSRVLIEEFLNGQADTLLGALMVGTLYLVNAKRWWSAAAALALAILLKLPAALLLIYFGLRREWGLVRRTIFCGLGLAIAGAVLLAPSQPIELLRAWVETLQSSGADRAFEIGSQSFLALLSRFLTNDGYHLNVLNLSRPMVLGLAFFLQMAAVLALALPWRGNIAEPPQRRVLDGAMLMTMAALFSPTCWLPTYTILAFPLLAAAAALATQLRRSLRDPWSVGLTLTILALSWFMKKQAWRLIGVRAIAGEEYTYLAAMIAPWMGLALAALLWRQRGVTARTPE